MQTETLHIQTAPSATLHIALTAPPVPTTTPTLLFLHYWGGTNRTFHHLITSLSPIYPTISITHRGWGLSTGPDDASNYSIATQAADVLFVLQQLRDRLLNGVVLVGHSMGAKIAMAVAGKNPSGLRSLILIAPAPATPLVLSDEIRTGQKSAYEDRESVVWTIHNVLSSPDALSEENFEMVVEDSLSGNRWAKAGWPEYGMLEDVSGDLEGGGMKVLIFAGGRDKVETMERVQETGRWLEGRGFPVRTVVVEAGHLLVLEKPEELVGEMKGELEEM